MWMLDSRREKRIPLERGDITLYGHNSIKYKPFISFPIVFDSFHVFRR